MPKYIVDLSEEAIATIAARALHEQTTPELIIKALVETYDKKTRARLLVRKAKAGGGDHK